MGYIKTRDIHKDGISASVIRGGRTRNPWARTLYVSSTHRRASDTARSGEDMNHPLATVQQATAMIITKGWTDTVIFVGAGHVETVSGNWTIGGDGTAIVGVGHGDRRPAFTFDTTVAARAWVSGNGVVLNNLHFKAGIDSLTYMVRVVGTDVQIIDCEVSHDATYQAINAILVSASGARCTITGLYARQAAVGATGCIANQGGSDMSVLDCDIVGDYSGGCIDNTGTAAAGLKIKNCELQSTHANDTCIGLVSTATGFIVNNRCRIATDGQVTWIDASNCTLGENYGGNNNGETGKLIGTVSI